MSEFVFSFPGGSVAPPTSTVAEGAIDHVRDALDRLPEQYRSDDNVLALVAALARPAQAIEDALQQLLTDRSVDTAVGAQLDIIGKLVGQARNGQLDDDYRRYIRARIKTNRSNGTAEDLIRIAKLVVNDPDLTVRLDLQGVAALVVHLDDTIVSEDTAQAAIYFLRQAVAGGVRLILEYTTSAPAGAFRFDSGPGLDNGHFADAVS